MSFDNKKIEMKLTGPISTLLRTILYNIVAVLIVLVIVTVFFSGKGGPSTDLKVAADWCFAGLVMLLMFPCSLLLLVTIDTTNATMVFLSQHVFPIVMLLNPLIWGGVGYSVHKAVQKRIEKKIEPAPPAGRGEAPRP